MKEDFHYNLREMIMNKRIALLIALTSVVLLSSCTKQVSEQEEPVTSDNQSFFVIAGEPEFISEHDAQLSEFAKALGCASKENAGLRRMIKEESLKRFDGDVDFLVSKAIDKPVVVAESVIATKGLSESQTFGSLVSQYINDNVKSGENLIEKILAEYPDLQVAVPVHAEEWDPEEYTPVIAFIPEDYNDMVTKTVPGYDANGNYVLVDALNEPDVPVIVVSHNERMAENERVVPLTETLVQAPSSPTGLSAMVSDEAIALSWNPVSDCFGYSVWRHDPGNTQFHEVIRLSPLTTGFYDSAITASTIYQYYVCAYNLSEGTPVYSLPSNTISVTAPSVLPPLANFSVRPSGTALLFSWSSGDTHSSTIVLKEKGPDDMFYHEIARRPSSNSYNIYIPSDRGRCHDYIAYRTNAMGDSEALSTFIYPPFRNSSQTSHTYTRRLTITNNLDGWLYGAPEFFLDVFGLTAAGTVEKLNRVWMYFTDGYKDKSESFTNKDAYSWVITNPANDWYKSVLLWLFEDDGGTKITLSGTFSLEAKIMNLLGLSAGIGFSTSVQDDDDNCGSVMLYYFDNPETTLEFPNYGTRLRISEAGSGSLD